MNQEPNNEAAETVQTTSVPAVDLPRLVRLLGVGKSRQYKAAVGWQLVEHHGNTYEVHSDVFCKHCEGCGCTRCKFTGHTSGKEIGFPEPNA